MWKPLITAPAFSPLLGFFLMYTREAHFLLSHSASYFYCQWCEHRTRGCFHILESFVLHPLTRMLLYHYEKLNVCSAEVQRLPSHQLHSLVSRFDPGPDPKSFTIIPSPLFLSLSYIHWKLNQTNFNCKVRLLKVAKRHVYWSWS